MWCNSYTVNFSNSIFSFVFLGKNKVVILMLGIIKINNFLVAYLFLILLII
jgi:hypothetical protein